MDHQYIHIQSHFETSNQIETSLPYTWMRQYFEVLSQITNPKLPPYHGLEAFGNVDDNFQCKVLE